MKKRAMSRCFGSNEWKAWSYEDNDRPSGNSKTENPKDGFPRWKILLSILHTHQCYFLFKVHNFTRDLTRVHGLVYSQQFHKGFDSSAWTASELEFYGGFDRRLWIS